MSKTVRDTPKLSLNPTPSEQQAVVRRLCEAMKSLYTQIADLEALVDTLSGADLTAILADIAQLQSDLATLQAQVNAIPPNDLVWQWNGVDASQFNSTPVLGPGSSNTAAISVVSDSAAPRGAKLRVEASFATTPPATGAKVVHFEALQALPPGNYRVEFETVQTDAAVASYRGMFFLGEGATTSHYCYAFLGGGTSTQLKYRVDAGAIVDSATANSAGWGANVAAGAISLAKWFLRAVKTGGSPPKFSSGGQSWLASAIAVGTALPSHFEGTPAPSGWNSLACRQWGLALRFVSNGAGACFWDIADLRIYRADG